MFDIENTFRHQDRVLVLMPILLIPNSQINKSTDQQDYDLHNKRNPTNGNWSA